VLVAVAIVPSAVAVRVAVQFWPPHTPIVPVPGPSTCVVEVRPSQRSVASTPPLVTTMSTVRRTPQLLHSTGGGPWVEHDDETPAAASCSVVAQSGLSTAEACEGIAVAMPETSTAERARRFRRTPPDGYYGPSTESVNARSGLSGLEQVS
jgi:hypothetical protein